MLEKPCIQSRGFRNIVENGEVTGFQIKVRLLYYRGLWLSQIRNTSLSVDGVKYSDDQITWIVAGKAYSQADLKTLSDVHWGINEKAVLVVKQPNGLATGYHNVEFDLKFSSSYFPPVVDTLLSGPAHTRTLLLV